ncbi:MAG TPA: ABC transporter substrate-binding protein [Stellaceae bacterium]|nr:ABC transporter substrate-binding protein [Stellaceae bacterium]
MKRLLFALTAAMALAATTSFADEPIKVGVLITTTGPYAPWGRDYKQGVDLYVEQHSGKDGNPTVQVIYSGDVGGDNPPRARQLATEMIVRDHVAILGGLEFTTTTLAMADVINQAKIPFIIFNSATSVVVDKSPYYVRPAFTLWPSSMIAAKYATDQKKMHGTIVSADYAPGKDAIDAFTYGMKQNGGDILDVIKVPMGTTDFSSYFQRIADKMPDVLYVFMPGGPMSVGMANGYVQRGWAKQGMLYIGGGVNERDLPAMGNAALGVASVLNYTPYLDNPTNKAFRAAFAKKYGDKLPDDLPTFATVDAYDGMDVMFHMLKATDGGKGGGDAMMAAAKGYSFESPRGPVTIDPKTREAIQNFYVTKVEMVDGVMANKPIATYPNVKDPWHEMHPPTQ